MNCNYNHCMLENNELLMITKTINGVYTLYVLQFLIMNFTNVIY